MATNISKSRSSSVSQSERPSAIQYRSFSNQTKFEYWLNIDGKDYSLEGGSIRIGRAPDNQIVLDHPSVSRNHVEVSISDDGVFIEDLKSRNGLKVRGARVQRAELRNRDRFEIGDVQGLFIQKHLQATTLGAAEETAAGLAPRSSLLERYHVLSPQKKKLVLGLGALIFIALLVQVVGGGGSDLALTPEAQAGVQENPCSPEKISRETTNWAQFEDCREHEDLGNYRLARACLGRMKNTKDVCEAAVRVSGAQDTLTKVRYEEGQRAFSNYYYDLAILKWQEVVLISDDGSEFRELAKQGIAEAQKKKMISR